MLACPKGTTAWPVWLSCIANPMPSQTIQFMLKHGFCDDCNHELSLESLYPSFFCCSGNLSLQIMDGVSSSKHLISDLADLSAVGSVISVVPASGSGP